MTWSTDWVDWLAAIFVWLAILAWIVDTRDRVTRDKDEHEDTDWANHP